jgi:hypothetical protein
MFHRGRLIDRSVAANWEKISEKVNYGRTRVSHVSQRGALESSDCESREFEPIVPVKQLDRWNVDLSREHRIDQIESDSDLPRTPKSPEQSARMTKLNVRVA